MKEPLSEEAQDMETTFRAKGRLMSLKRIKDIKILADVIDNEVIAELDRRGLTGKERSAEHSALFFPAMDKELIKRKWRI